ncbi:MAG TPA: PDZ domain-containing protein [Gemmatimonadaceae bacterium]|nr:PDZ domain-containing protein [Gemmatimonadaceae bacterium]
MSRSFAHAPLVSITLALVAGAAPLAAQRVDVMRRTTPRVAGSDSVEAQLHRLERTVDSLTQLYDDDDLSGAERRRIGMSLDLAMARFEALRAGSERWNDPADTRTFVGVRVGPMSRDGADNASSLSRTIMRQTSPRGWIGIVVYNAATEVRIERGELFLRYLTYPRITSVDPSSPAERAGIEPNDTLLAYNGRDVRSGEISTTSLLKPNSRVMVRVRREGRVREMPVIVAEAPQRIVQRRQEEMRDVQMPWVLGGMPEAPAFARVPPPMGVRIGSAPRPPIASLPPLPPMASSFSFVSNGVVGASMVTVTEGLGRTLGLRSGVLITFAPASSPAAESGLRDGDVLVSVDGQPVRTVNDVRELISRARDNGEQSVPVELVRERRSRKLTLRW